MSKTIPILIRSASGLLNSDFFSKSDPYCLVRLGTIGKDWNYKSKKTERCSAVVVDSLNPEWNLAFLYKVDKDKINTFELHIRIYDNDIFNNDDLIGETTIPISHLLNNYNIAKQHNIAPQGYIVILCGDNVSINNLSSIKNDHLWVSALRQYFDSVGDNIIYTTNMIKFLLAGIKSDVGLRDWLLAKGGESGIWKGPEDDNCLTFMNHKDVCAKLKELPVRLGTNNINGQAVKINNLGFQKLNNYVWKELDYSVIGLGQTQENHALIRGFFEKTIGSNGNWNRKLVQKYVKKFFSTRTSFNTFDFKIWTTIVLHKVHLNIELSWTRGIRFMKMQAILLISIAMGNSVIENKLVRSILGIDKAIKEKEKWLNIYIEALKKDFSKDVENLSGKQLVLMASNIMDSLLFAGGQSVPTVLSYCTTLPYSSWFTINSPNTKITNDNITRYIMEVIRFFPPVGGFAYKERSFSNSPSTNIYLSIQTAQSDTNVWKDGNKFILRSMNDYNKLMVAWADPAIGTEKYKCNSRACPAKELSFVMIYEMLKTFISYKWTVDKKPDDISVTGYSISSVEFDKRKN